MTLLSRPAEAQRPAEQAKSAQAALKKDETGLRDAQFAELLSPAEKRFIAEVFAAKASREQTAKKEPVDRIRGRNLDVKA
jgi:hypothetical protein